MPSVDTAFLHGLTTQTDGSECEFSPTGGVEGMSQRVRKPKRSAQVYFPAQAVPIGCTRAGSRTPYC